MKKSNRLLIAATIVTLVSMVAYDFMLKKEFQSGSYKNSLRDFTELDFKNFDAVDINSSTAVNVHFKQGPFRVLLDNYTSEFAKIVQHGSRLQINAVYEGEFRNDIQPYSVIIYCPVLHEVTANATYSTYGKLYTDTVVREAWNVRQILIDGFSQDSMHISSDYGSIISMENNHLSNCKAIIGTSDNASGKLIIAASNQVQNMYIELRNKSKLILENATIDHLNYSLAASSQLTINGNAQHLLTEFKSINK